MTFYPPLMPQPERDGNDPQTTHAEDHNTTAAAIRAIVAELGPSPAGAYGSVTERMEEYEDMGDVLDAALPLKIQDPGDPVGAAVKTVAERSVAAAYTPTWVGVTGGTRTGSYRKFGNLVVYTATWTLTGSWSFTGQVNVSLPHPTGNMQFGTYVLMNDAGNTYFSGWGWHGTPGSVALFGYGGSGVAAPINATTPFTWATGDSITVSGAYILPPT